MRKVIRFGLLGVTLIFAMLFVTGVQAGRQHYLYLRWREVVPAGSGDPNLSGTAVLDLNPGKGQLCYTLRVGIFAALEQPTGATIHQAPVRQNGPLVVDLDPDYGPLGQPEATGCVSLSSSLAHNMQRNPSDYYILVTDMDYPDGAARAQLTK